MKHFKSGVSHLDFRYFRCLLAYPKILTRSQAIIRHTNCSLYPPLERGGFTLRFDNKISKINDGNMTKNNALKIDLIFKKISKPNLIS